MRGSCSRRTVRCTAHNPAHQPRLIVRRPACRVPRATGTTVHRATRGESECVWATLRLGHSPNGIARGVGAGAGMHARVDVSVSVCKHAHASVWIARWPRVCASRLSCTSSAGTDCLRWYSCFAAHSAAGWCRAIYGAGALAETRYRIKAEAPRGEQWTRRGYGLLGRLEADLWLTTEGAIATRLAMRSAQSTNQLPRGGAPWASRCPVPSLFLMASTSGNSDSGMWRRVCRKGRLTLLSRVALHGGCFSDSRLPKTESRPHARAPAGPAVQKSMDPKS